MKSNGLMKQTVIKMTLTVSEKKENFTKQN